MEKIETYNPIFCGFYDSIFALDENAVENFISDWCESHRLNKDLVLEVVNHNYDKCMVENTNEYYNEFGNKACDWLEESLKPIFHSEFCIKFERVLSPKEYNFANDSIYCCIELENKNKFIDEIGVFVCKHEDDFAKYIEENYTSHDGFSSHYTNDYKDWINDIENYNLNEHQIGSILYFMLQIQYEDIDVNFAQEMYENVCKEYYLSFTDEFKNFLDKEFKKFNDDYNKLIEQSKEYIRLMKIQNVSKNYTNVVKKEIEIEKEKMENEISKLI